MFKIAESGNADNSIEIEVLQRPLALKKFIVNIRRPKDYTGKYGFDWLRDEYVYPITTVTNDNQGNAIGVPTPLCLNVSDLKTEYKTTGVPNSITPYGKDYYPAWLSIFPHTTTTQFAHGSRMHKGGVNLDVEIEEIESLVNDDTKIIFESSNPNLKVNPDNLNLKDLIKSKKTKNLGGTLNRDYYLGEKKINIKCSGGVLTNHEEIKIFAELNGTREEVGKLMVHKNDVIPKAEIVAVNVITAAASPSLRDDYQYLFKNQSFNQAVVRAEVKVDTKFDLTSLSAHSDVSTFLSTCSSMSASVLQRNITALYERYGKHKPVIGKIDDSTNTKTYLFYTDILAGRVNGICSLNRATREWGNQYVIFSGGLSSKRTVVHECGHSFSLPHIFQEGSYAGSHTFYQGYTDNYMDYNWQKGRPVDPSDLSKGYYSSGDNKNKGKMYSLFKWQWSTLRSDRSLIFSY